MGWRTRYEAVKEFVIKNKEQLNSKTVWEFVSILAKQFDISPVTLRTQYVKALEVENIIKIKPSNPDKPKATRYPKIVEILV